MKISLFYKTDSINFLFVFLDFTIAEPSDTISIETSLRAVSVQVELMESNK